MNPNPYSIQHHKFKSSFFPFETWGLDFGIWVLKTKHN